MGCEALFSLWRKWIRFVVILVYVVLLVIAVPLCIWELEKKGAPDHVQAWFVGGMFVLMALPISFWGILQHVLNYTTPYLQRHIIRVLWMVPVYALNAWFALRFPEAAIYLDTLRECYEAYVIYNFMAYLLSFLYHEYPDIDEQVESKPPISFLFPLCLLPPCSDGRKFIQRCKHGVLQYTIVRPLMTIIAFICEMCDKYGEGDFNFSTAWSYIVIIGNFSQIFAMYCLVLFYKAFRHELKPLKPVPKFLCVKAVVFLSFWQGLFIAVLTKTNVIPSNGAWVFYKDIKQVSTGIQDFLICIEMFLAAIAHYFSFSHKPFVNMAADQQDCCSSFMSMWDVRDVTGDVVEHAKYIGLY
ncbi:transmembrane protein 184C-like [Physella acuta]|uniref:transmembrane protein 184C-like n=1 Tax=Physella acuta TaxID=109671 RepID=UPI0027DE166D|nr:transmembrane protein 184C-like [Physella acuta]